MEHPVKTEEMALAKQTEEGQIPAPRGSNDEDATSNTTEDHKAKTTEVNVHANWTGEGNLIVQRGSDNGDGLSHKAVEHKAMTTDTKVQ